MHGLRRTSVPDILSQMWCDNCTAVDEAMSIGAWRTVPRKKAKSIVGRSRDTRVVCSVNWAGFLSTSQIERLHFPSRRTAQRRLRALLDHRLIRACLQGTSLHLQNVYALAPAGVAYLESRGITGDRPRRIVRAQKLEHALAVRDLFVAFCVAAQSNRIELQDFRFEDDLAREAIFQAAGIIPDGLAMVRHGDRQLAVGCEIDLGSETRRMLESKCEHWAELLRKHPFGPMKLLFVVAGVGRKKAIELLLEKAGCPGITVLRSSVITEPFEVVERLFARAIRAARIGELENEKVFRILSK